MQFTDQNTLLHPWVKAALTAAGCPIGQGYQSVPATYLLQRYHAVVEVELPLIVSDLTTAHLPQLQLILRNAYPATHPITVFYASSGKENGVTATDQTTVDALDAGPTSHCGAPAFAPGLSVGSQADAPEYAP